MRHRAGTLTNKRAIDCFNRVGMTDKNLIDLQLWCIFILKSSAYLATTLGLVNSI
jgi:hypothetical protein